MSIHIKLNFYRKTIIIILSAGTFIIAMVLLYFGIIRFNYLSFSEYPVQGLDISHHQGEIRWDVLKKSKYMFVFIKATEGGDFIDPLFINNYKQARQYDFYIGAYHFFTFRKPGKVQAENFVANVPVNAIDLPPVIDLEYMGNSKKRHSRAGLHKQLQIFINKLEKRYGVKPILYTTYEFYDRYLAGNFKDHPLWIRDIFKKPGLADRRKWTFWQYTNRGKLPGINGFVDLNVFNGNMSEFERFINEKK